MERVRRRGAWMMTGGARAGAAYGSRLFWGGAGSPGSSAKGAVDLDLEHLSRQTFGDRELEDELLRLFDEQAVQILARLAAPFEAAEADRRADVAHALKGSALAIGAMATADVAGAYEVALRGGDPGAEPYRRRLAQAIEAARRAVANRRMALRDGRLSRPD